MSALAESLPQGLVPPSRPQGRSGFLADVIVELGLADREAVDAASNESRQGGVTLASVLLKNGVLDEAELARAVAERHGLATVDLDLFAVDPEAGGLVGRATARRYGVLPAGFAPDGSLLLAMTDPGDSLARSDVAVMTKLEVTPVIAARTQIHTAIERLPAMRLAVSEQADPEPEPEAAGALLWQAEESPAGEVEQRGRATDLERRLDELDAQIRELRQELGERDARIAALDGELAYRDGRLGELERQVAERDAAVRKLEADQAGSRRGAA